MFSSVKKWCLVAVCFAGSYCHVIAQESPKRPSVVAVDRPLIEFGMLSLADVNRLQTLEAKFKLTNKGDKKLIIEQVATSCGCTSATPSATEIRPGEAIDVKTVIKLEGRSGYNLAKIVVGLSEGEVVELTAKYTIEIGAKIFPLQVNLTKRKDREERFEVCAYLAFPKMLTVKDFPKMEMTSTIPGVVFTQKQLQLSERPSEKTGYYYSTVSFEGVVGEGINELDADVVLNQEGVEVCRTPLHVSAAKDASLSRDSVYLGKIQRGAVAHVELNLSDSVENANASVEMDGLVVDSVSIKRSGTASVISFEVRWNQSGVLASQRGEVVTANGRRLPFTCIASMDAN